MEEIFHSVYLDKEKCMGCTTCLRSCPTAAIRIRDGKARIIKNKCIDCGECIRVCPHQAKQARTTPLSEIKKYKYTVAIPAPTLLGQFEPHYSINAILTGLKALGFDEVVEVAYGAEIIGRGLALEIEKEHVRPLISSACPAVTKLIQIRFPELTKNISRLRAPMGMTARIVRKRLNETTAFTNEEIGIFFITPCAAKATEVVNADPMEDLNAAVNGAISIKEIYPDLFAHIKNSKIENLQISTVSGFSWAVSGGESAYLHGKKILHVDGIANVISILEEIENGKLPEIDFFEGLACIGGCVGGCLTVENNFIAKMYIEDRAKAEKEKSDKQISQALIEKIHDSGMMHVKQPIKPRVFKPLDPDFQKAIEKMQAIEKLEEELPGLDCGSCGAPSCRALAEDIIAGKASKLDCIFMIKDKLLEYMDKKGSEEDES